MLSLFDDFERTDWRGSTRQTDAFEFLNRVAAPGWSRVRDEIERWFGVYCEDAGPEKARDLRARLRSSDPRQHLGAWWELYTHRVLRALHPNGRVEVEPTQEGVTTKPDFVITTSARERPSLVVESVTTRGGILTDGRLESDAVAYVLDTIDEIRCPDFQIHLELRTVAAARPKKRAIKQPIEAWLATLDPEVERAKRIEQRIGQRQWERITFGDWEIEVEPIAMRTPIDDKRLIGIGPSVGGYVNDSEPLKDAVLTKARRYGSLSVPYVIGVAPTSPILHGHDVVAALLGTLTRRFDPDHPEGGELFLVRDGAWTTGAEAVTGVLTGAGIAPWTVAQRPPVLWLNPNPEHSLDQPMLQLPHVEFTDNGDSIYRDGSVSIAELLGLDPDWPGDLWAT